jgi:hypothetical protein
MNGRRDMYINAVAKSCMHPRCYLLFVMNFAAGWTVLD